jgi:chromosome segregation ATPase
LAENTRPPHDAGKPSDTSSSEEEALRRSLDRLGATRPAALGRMAQTQAALDRGEPPRSRRRFAQDGEVQVEWRSHPSGSSAEADPPSSDGIAALRSRLNAEHEAHAAAKEQLRDARAKIQHLETRLAHLQMDLQDAERRQALAAVRAGEPTPAPVPAAQPVKRGRPRKQRPAPPGFPKQRPVKWW